MTCYIDEEAVSSLKDGIETILIPLHDSWDLEDLVFHSKRGGTYDVVEWLLSQLYRSSEIERVCGLSITPLQGGVVQVNLEMRQPGRQLEQWFLEGHRVGHYEEVGSDILFTDSAYIREGPVLKLCGRCLSQEKFTDKHRPWWEKEIRVAILSVSLNEAKDMIGQSFDQDGEPHHFTSISGRDGAIQMYGVKER